MMKKIVAAISIVITAFLLSFFEYNSIYFLATIPFFVVLLIYKNHYCFYAFLGMLLAAVFINFKVLPIAVILFTFFTIFLTFILNKFKINYKYLLSIISGLFALNIIIFSSIVSQKNIDLTMVLTLPFILAFLTYNVVLLFYDLKFKEEISITKKQLCFISVLVNLLSFNFPLNSMNFNFNFVGASIANFIFIMIEPIAGIIGILVNSIFNLYYKNSLFIFFLIPLAFSWKKMKKSPAIRGLIYAFISLVLMLYVDDFSYAFEIIIVSLLISFIPNKVHIFLQKYIVEPHDYDLKLYQKSYYKCLSKNKKIYKTINLLEERMNNKESTSKMHKEIFHETMQFLSDKLKEEEDIKVKENILKELRYLKVEILGFKVFLDYFYNYKIILEIKGNKPNIDKAIVTIENYLGVSLCCDYKYHNSVLNSYVFVLKNNEKIKFNLSIKQRSVEAGQCGDSYLVFNTKNKKYLLISDGMGHGKNANQESSRALLLLKDFIELGMEAKFAIFVCNALIYNKEKETFNTLDLFEYDINEDEMYLYKNGSGSTYIRHDKRVERINSKNLPLGIVEEINVERKVLNKNIDYVILTSDGIKKDLTKVISESKKRNSKLLCDEILKFEGNDIEDDQTIVVISVIKKDGVC